MLKEFDRRVILLSLLLFVITLSFWGQSRYPALESKAMMGENTVLDDALSFDSIVDFGINPALHEKILSTYINWIYVNWQGMTFGLVIAILLLVLLPLIVNKLPQGRITSTLTGIFIGTPLGLCVNCAAPAALGLYKGGARAEIALATMLSSPALNVIVLGMLLTMLPWYIAYVKITLSIIMILLAVPLLVRYFGDEIKFGALSHMSSSAPVAIGLHGLYESHAYPVNSWLCGLDWTLKTIFRASLWLLIRILPLMLLAGLIGAILVNLVSWDMIVRVVTSNPLETMLLLLGVAIFGVLLPVPITFDVIVVTLLFAAGLNTVLASTLLFTLGSFSIYSLFVIWQAGMRKISLTLLLIVATTGMLAGFISDQLSERVEQKRADQAIAMLSGAHQLKDKAETTDTLLAERIPLPFSNANTVVYEDTAYDNIQRMVLNKKESSGDWHMKKIPGTEIGLTRAFIRPDQQVASMTTSYAGGFSLVSGDVNRDGYADVVSIAEQGINVFINQQGESFTGYYYPVNNMDTSSLGALALNDINNDGWLDLVYSLSEKGLYVALNDTGRFSSGTKVFSSTSASPPSALAFGDINQDGQLDIIVGGSFSYRYPGTNFDQKYVNDASNYLLLQDKGIFIPHKLSGLDQYEGWTWSILISDLSAGDEPDVWIGNDFVVPDIYYENHQGRLIEKVNFPVMTRSTMSLDSADIDNNLSLETFHAQISRDDGRTWTSRQLSPTTSFDDIISSLCQSHQECINELLMMRFSSGMRSNSPSACLDLSEEARVVCTSLVVYINATKLAYRENSAAKAQCDLLKENYFSLHKRCLEEVRAKTVKHNVSVPEINEDPDVIKQDHGMRESKSRLLFWEQREEKSEDYGVAVAEWGWNSKFADLDGDGWQDIYIANGIWERKATSNIWYRNMQGRKFSADTASARLEYYWPTMSYAYLDVENDGDLDILVHSFTGRLELFQNTNNKNNYIQLELDDRIGNRMGIGSKITIHLRDGSHQMRELKASGGTLSYDPALAHFGLGQHDAVQSIDIRWSTGETDNYDGVFQSGYRYRITRISDNASSTSQTVLH